MMVSAEMIDCWRFLHVKQTVHLLNHVVDWIIDNSPDTDISMLVPLIRSLDEYFEIEPGQK